MRYFIEMAYRGTNYHGFQVQKGGAATVQGTVEAGLCKILRLPGVATVGSGRTDTGVHARQQYLQVDLTNDFEPADLAFKLNALLPKDIGIRAVHPMVPKAHARFDATARSYEYQICQWKDPFLTDRAYLFGTNLNVPLMNQAGELLKQWQDFESLSKVKTDVKTFICHITEAEWRQTAPRLLTFHVTANRFLRGMVRTIVGTMLDIGTGKTTLDQLTQILESRDRTQAGRSVPARGLCLTRIEYPDEIFLKP